MMKVLHRLLLASTLMVPCVAPAIGGDHTTRPGATQQGQAQARSPGQLQLPPLPYIESMQWLNSLSTSKGPKVDFLLGPNLELPGPLFAARSGEASITPSAPTAGVTGLNGAPSTSNLN
jgi:hypothetical protein